MDLALLIERLGNRLVPETVGKAVGDATGFGHRLTPCAVDLHDLGAMNEAGPGEGDELGLGIAPRRERRGPFAGTIECVDLVAGGDHGAIDDPGHNRGKLAGGRCDHRLVEESEAFSTRP